MTEATDKALLRAGYNVHMELESMISEIEKNQTQWAEIIEKHFDNLQLLIKKYHKIAFKVTTDAEKNGLPDYLKIANDNALEVMDAFNEEILNYDNFLDNIHHPQHLISLIHQVNKTNDLLKKLKN